MLVKGRFNIVMTPASRRLISGCIVSRLFSGGLERRLFLRGVLPFKVALFRGLHSTGYVPTTYQLLLAQGTSKSWTSEAFIKDTHSRSFGSRRPFSSSSWKPNKFDKRRGITPFGALWRILPMQVKATGALFGVLSLIFFLTAPFLIIMIPPLLFAGMFFGRRIQARNVAMFSKRWERMLNDHLAFQPKGEALTEQEQIGSLALRQVQLAVAQNQHNLAGALRIDSSAETISNLRVTPIEDLEQQYKYSNFGLNDSLTVFKLGLLSGRNERRIATVNVVVRNFGDTSPNDQSIQIEVQPSSGFYPLSQNPIILDSSDLQDAGGSSSGYGRVIDVKGRTIRREQD